MHKIVLVIAACAMVGLSQVRDAHACSCLPPPPPATALEESDAVFAGRIIEVSREMDPIGITATLAVSTVWKGAIEEIVEVRTPQSSAGCGLDFALDEEWLLYANWSEGSLGSHLCSRSVRLRFAAEDLAALGPGRPPGESR